MNKSYGIILSIGLALLSIFLSTYIPLGSVAIAIILGAVFSNSVTIPKKFESGISFSEKTLLAIAISLLGIHLDFNILFNLGFNTVLLIIISLLATLIFTFYLSNKYDFVKNFALILGIGNGICGSAAIAATKDILKVNKEKSALAIAIVNLLGTVGLFVLPFILLMLGFDDTHIGIVLGNTLQSVGHAVAAGFSVNETVGQSATIVKMGRILLLTPVIFWLIYYMSRNSSVNKNENKKLQVPIFIYGFIFFSILSTFSILPQSVIDILAYICKLTLTVAMAAIGLKISFNAIKQTGWEAFVLASYIFKFQIILSVILVAILIN